MIVSISLDNAFEHFTNLDVVTGKVFLQVPNPTNVSSIVVKLEGESKTRLLAPAYPNRPIHPHRPEKQRPVLEIHKFLYKTQILWPTNLRPEDLANNAKASFGMAAGQFAYPFSFKIPLNTSCQQATGAIAGVSFTNAIPEFAQTPTHHVKTTLPPSLSGFPGEAEIKYFVKVTVNRPSLFKENPRSAINFTFLPIEPPRPEKNGERFASNKHEFLEMGNVAAGKLPDLPNRNGSTTSLSTPGAMPPRIKIDARLPNPAILTCNQDLPLRLLLRNKSARTKNIFLQSLQIQLVGYTVVRAHEVSRKESNSWVLCSFSNMAIPIGSPSDAIDTETPINPEYWTSKPIPNMIPPTFTTCNLSRFYELDIRVGLGYGSYQRGEDQFVVIPLRMQVQLYSGIAPPKALLDAKLAEEAGRPYASNLTVPPPQQQAPHTPTTPTYGGFGKPGGGFPGQPVQSQTPAAATATAPAYEEAPPPSYEEAIGADLPPINGYRGSYQPPPVPEGAPGFSDGKQR